MEFDVRENTAADKESYVHPKHSPYPSLCEKLHYLSQQRYFWRFFESNLEKSSKSLENSVVEGCFKQQARGEQNLAQKHPPPLLFKAQPRIWGIWRANLALLIKRISQAIFLCLAIFWQNIDFYNSHPTDPYRCNSCSRPKIFTR